MNTDKTDPSADSHIFFKDLSAFVRAIRVQGFSYAANGISDMFCVHAAKLGAKTISNPMLYLVNIPSKIVLQRKVAVIIPLVSP